MKQIKFIKGANLPPRLSILTPLMWWLVLDHFSAPGWAYGVIYTGIAVVYLVEVWRLFAGTAVDLLGSDK